MRIAHMTAEHVPQVAALEKVCFSDPWSENSVASELENPLSCWLVALDRAARQGDETKYVLPRSKPGENPYNMSFSGLKTAALNLIHHAEQVGEELDIPSLCAAFSAAVSDTLVPRAVMALEQTGYRKIAVAGGVAANSRIRADILAAAEKLGAEVYLPPLHLCGDNGAMIGAQAYYEYKAGHVADMSLNAYATKSILGEAL